MSCWLQWRALIASSSAVDRSSVFFVYRCILLLPNDCVFHSTSCETEILRSSQNRSINSLPMPSQQTGQHVFTASCCCFLSSTTATKICGRITPNPNALYMGRGVQDPTVAGNHLHQSPMPSPSIACLYASKHRLTATAMVRCATAPILMMHHVVIIVMTWKHACLQVLLHSAASAGKGCVTILIIASLPATTRSDH